MSVYVGVELLVDDDVLLLVDVGVHVEVLVFVDIDDDVLVYVDAWFMLMSGLC